MAEEAELRRKLERACQLLLLPRYKVPGVKGWELRRSLGREYPKIIEALDDQLGRLGLRVVKVFEEGREPREPSLEELDRARFLISFRNPLTISDAESSGWRVDDLAVLAASLAYIISRGGKAPRKQVEELLREKFPKWKVQQDLERFVRRGYLVEREDSLYLGWRSRAEIDEGLLMNLILTGGLSGGRSPS